MKDSTKVDLLGIGYGPAAIAVATALEDDNEFLPPGASRNTALFLDRGPTAAWQPDMLLPGTDIQHHFLRDFATPRNPRSRFTFPSYLVDTDRLYPFTNLAGYVSRHEWSQYVRWVTDRLTVPVTYDTEVTEVRPVVRDGRVAHARVLGENTATGQPVEHLARNVLVSMGHQPFVPEQFQPFTGDRLFHSHEFLTRMSAIEKDSVRRVAVIGAGQNAGEIFLHLANTLPDAEIHALTRNSGFRLYNLSHFSNEAYFPAETDYFYSLDAAQRKKVFEEVYSTNYACVDPDVNTGLYRAMYDDRNWGPGRLHLHKRSGVESLSRGAGGGFRLVLDEVNTGEREELEADLVILCTGFREPKMPGLLEPFAEYIEADEAGDPAVTREFRLGTTPDCSVGLYLNGITEWRHGINSATSFSTMAVKAGQILRDLDARRDAAATVDDITVPV